MQIDLNSLPVWAVLAYVAWQFIGPKLGGGVAPKPDLAKPDQTADLLAQLLALLQRLQPAMQQQQQPTNPQATTLKVNLNPTVEMHQ